VFDRLDAVYVERAVRALIFKAAAVLAVAVSGAGLAPAGAQQVLTAPLPNNTPLSFGMDANEASLALGTTLNYISGRAGDELYLALPNVKGATLSGRRDGLYLQFRRGRLEAWKGEWNARLPWRNY
jgi:hypothetical protein